MNNSQLITFNLNNNITVIIEHRPGSEVFALCLCAPDRCIYETPDKTGTGEILAMLMSDGCGGRSRGELLSELNGMGAILRTSQRKPIPEDNYFNNEQSVITVETLTRFAGKAVKLLREIIFSPNLDDNDISIRREQLITLLNEEEKKPLCKARSIFYSNVTGGHPYSRNPAGTREALKAITKEDLSHYREILFNPPNLIIAAETSLNPHEAVLMLKEAFSSYTPDWEILPVKTNIPGFSDFMPGRFENIAEGKTSAVMTGFPVSIPPEDEAAMQAAMSLLSSHLSYRLRECQGFAYAVSTSLEKTRYGSFVKVSLETSEENARAAVESLGKELSAFPNEYITSDDIRRIRESYRGVILRERLSSINRAFHLAQNYILGEPLNYYSQILKEMETLTGHQVMKAMKKHLGGRKMVEVIC